MGTRNKLGDLNNHLFEALERLNDDELMSSELGEKEIERAKAITQVGGRIVDVASLTLDAHKYQTEWGKNSEPLPKMLLTDDDE